MKYSMISILSLLLGGVFALYLYFNTLTNQKLFYTIESQDLKHYNVSTPYFKQFYLEHNHF